MAGNMNRFISVFAVVFTLLVHIPAIAGEPSDGPGKAAEKFYAGYVALLDANKDTKSWVAKSKLVTADFKKSYVKKMSPKEGDALDSDPVLQAQDVPTSPFKAGKPTIKDNKATVILSAKFGSDTGRVNVQLVLTEGVWLVDRVQAGK
jgi:hypothetical protein